MALHQNLPESSIGSWPRRNVGQSQLKGYQIAEISVLLLSAHCQPEVEYEANIIPLHVNCHWTLATN